MTKKKYDLLVIGAGAAGSAAAEQAAASGHSVAMVERDRLGGTCLNYGCDPTKALVHNARLLHQARNAARLGLAIPQADVDWAATRKRLASVIRSIRGGSQPEARAELAAKGIELLTGSACFTGPHKVSIDGRTIEFKRAVIATGTIPAVPEIEGLKGVGFITNNEAVALQQLPRRMAIIGGGSLGVEFAQIFVRFGVEVTLLESGPLPLDQEDVEVAKQLCKLLKRDGIRIITGVELRCTATKSGAKRITVGGKGKDERIEVDEILVATGRKPALEGLGLEAAVVEASDKGIIVDKMLRTSSAHIWAAGDITGSLPFTHVASDQGKLAAKNAFAASPQPFDDSVIPWVTYTDPELAHIGQTEEQLKRAGTPYRVARMQFKELDRALASGETAGMVKLLAAEDGKLLGAHILGAGAGELLAGPVLAMRAGLSVTMLAETILPYPTMSEAVRWTAAKFAEGGEQ